MAFLAPFLLLLPATIYVIVLSLVAVIEYETGYIAIAHTVCKNE
ncbi:MAG: hypothetical protein ACOYJS_07855 [Acutalibacteraceae bacterium]|jgi:hypothetical protein